MRFVVIWLLCLGSLVGCRSAGSQATSARDPERRDAAGSMTTAEKEAQKQLQNW